MIRPLTGDDIAKGLRDCICWCGLGPDNGSCTSDMWTDLLEEVGAIGFKAYDGPRPAGILLFLPKTAARRIGLPTSPANEHLERTLVIGCLAIEPTYQNRGLASRMIRQVIAFARQSGYCRIEACKPGDGEGPMFTPFRKFRFLIESDREGAEFQPDKRICWLNLTGQ